MVLEQLFKPNWIEKKPRHAFLLGFIYSIVGIISAKLIFGANPGMMTVAFTSILLLPSLNTLLAMEENLLELEERRAKHKSNLWMAKRLWKDHYDIIEVYFYLFLGIFFTYCLVAFTLPETTILHMFEPMLQIVGLGDQSTTVLGWASNVAGPTVLSIFLNNFTVMIVCLLLSLIYGAGAILFITWNAAVWGVVIGFFARQSLMSTSGANPITIFISYVGPYFPHMTLEALPYFIAAIVGGIVSKASIREELFSPRFNETIKDAAVVMILSLIVLVVAAIVEINVYPMLA